jgi:hypothetical protein
MKRTSPFLRLLAVLFSVALIAAACGDDDSDADDSGETTQDEGSTAGPDEAGTDETGDEGGTDEGGTEATGDEATGDAASGDLPDEFFSEDCQEVYNAFLGAQTQLSTAFTGQVGDIEEAQASLDALAENAPDEVADAFETWAAEMAVFFDALADIGFDGSGQPTAEQMAQLGQVSDTVDEAALEEAGEEISVYFEDVCGA